MTDSLSSDIARRSVGKATLELSKTFERLSSGLRVNQASDDAAGLALATQSQAKMRVYSQAQKNVADGTSYLTIANSAADALKNIVERQKALAAEAQNATYTTEQRQALDAEFQELASQYNTIISQTEFNGEKVFDSQALYVQAGFGTAENIRVGLGDATNQHLPTGPYLISSDSNGNFSNGDSANPSMIGASRDGQFVVFNSTGSNLVSGDANGVGDVFIKNTVTGETRLLSTSTGGVQGNLNSNSAVISSDGAYVAYETIASNLVAGDTNGVSDVFYTSANSVTTTRISTSSAGVEGNGSSSDVALSATGRYAVFESDATNLVAGDSNGTTDIFLKDTVTGTTTRISVSSASAQANGASTDAHVSADGRYVTFTSSATNLVAGDTNGVDDIFVRDTLLGTTTMISKSTSGTIGNGASAASYISADGRYVIYDSVSTNLVSGDANGTRDVFMRDTVSGTTTLISKSTAGVQGNSVSSFGSVSDDGRYVAYVSGANNLVSNDTNGTNDDFVYDTLLGTTTLVSLTSTGAQAAGQNQGPYITGDGRYVMMQTTATNLQSGDTNGLYDMFLVRRDGSSSVSANVLSEMHGLQISTQGGAESALESLESYDDAISLYLGEVGAGLSRLNITETHSEVRAENYRAAVDRIQSIDMAEEVGNALRQKIIINSSKAIMAQANQQPGMVLSLLRA